MRRSYRRLALAPVLLTLALATIVGAGEAPQAARPTPGFDVETLSREGGRFARAALAWYQSTPPTDRVTWGGLAASALLGLGVLLDRMPRLRRRRIIPSEFEVRFLERLQDGRLDRGKAMDYCELNGSAASRVALAAVKRWGRPTPDLDRAVALAHRIEVDRLRRNVGTLRRIAALTPLLGLLGSLFAMGRVLSSLPATANAASWGPALAQALWPVTAGVALATIALVLYDGLAGRVEKLGGALEQIGAATIDAVVMALPAEPRLTIAHPAASSAGPSHGGVGRTPHQVRLEIPKPGSRVRIDDEDDYE